VLDRDSSSLASQASKLEAFGYPLNNRSTSDNLDVECFIIIPNT